MEYIRVRKQLDFMFQFLFHFGYSSCFGFPSVFAISGFYVAGYVFCSRVKQSIVFCLPEFLSTHSHLHALICAEPKRMSLLYKEAVGNSFSFRMAAHDSMEFEGKRWP